MQSWCYFVTLCNYIVTRTTTHYFVTMRKTDSGGSLNVRPFVGTGNGWKMGIVTDVYLMHMIISDCATDGTEEKASVVQW